MTWINYTLTSLGSVFLTILFLSILARRQVIPYSEKIKAAFGSVGQAVKFEDYRDTFNYYLAFFRVFKYAKKGFAKEAAVLQLLYIAYKMFTAQTMAGATLMKLHASLANKCEDFPAFNDFMNHEGAEIFADYHQHLMHVKNDFDKEFLQFIEVIYAEG